MWPWSKIRALEANLAAAEERRLLQQRAAQEAGDRADNFAAIAQRSLAQVQAERERFDNLLADYTDLRREGFDPPRPLPDAPPAADDLPPKVRAAILKRARPGSDLFGVLATYARNELAASPEGEEQIAGAIERGQDPEAFGV